MWFMNRAINMFSTSSIHYGLDAFVFDELHSWLWLWLRNQCQQTDVVGWFYGSFPFYCSQEPSYRTLHKIWIDWCYRMWVLVSKISMLHPIKFYFMSLLRSDSDGCFYPTCMQRFRSYGTMHRPFIHKPLPKTIQGFLTLQRQLSSQKIWFYSPKDKLAVSDPSLY